MYPSFISNNICIHLTFSNVPSHGRRHGPFHLITSHIPNVPSHLLGRRNSPLQLIINIYIHFPFPNVPSHLLGRRHGPLHAITSHIPQCTLTFTWEKT